VDVEGAEYEVLTGLKGILQNRGKPAILVVEIQGDNFERVKSLLQHLGYYLEHVEALNYVAYPKRTISP
jgi:hypothetical protein